MKYVVYYRVSTKKQGESGLGLESQKAMINHYLNSDDIVASFTDVLSGKSMDRPGLNEALQLCEDNGHTLAVAKIDRLSRTTDDALAIFKKLRGRLYSCDVPNLDKFTLTIFMAIADRERELISLRTKQALAERVKQGMELGTPANMTDEGRSKAHQANRDKAKANENNRRATALIMEMRSKKMTLQEIATKLNDSGYKTSQGKQFHKVTVSRLYNRSMV